MGPFVGYIACCGKGYFVLHVEGGIIGDSIFYIVIERWVEYSRFPFHDVIMYLSVGRVIV